MINSKGQFIKGSIPWNKGIKMTNEQKSKLNISGLAKGRYKGKKGLKNELNPLWKGDKVGYVGLHNWVRRNLGNPLFCVNGCIRKKYYWANISGEYKRDLSDWHSLCSSCNHTDGISMLKVFNRKGYRIGEFARS